MRRYRESESDWVREELEPVHVEKTCEACAAPGCGRGASRSRWRASDSRGRCAAARRMPLALLTKLKLGRREQADRQAGAARDRRTHGVHDRRRSGLPVHRPRRRERCRAARVSASAWRRRSAPGLSGVLYVLDEPSIGLHQRDNARLLASLRRLTDRGK